ncbi:MAG TPA: hypothetical protein VGC06_13975 [Actinomycetes bacterium]
MFESLRPQRGASQPTEEPGQPAPAHRTPRYLLELAFAVGAVVIAIAWLLMRAVSEPAGASFASHVVQPFVLLGLVVFAARALLRQRLRWCRSCRRWKAMEWRGERVLHRRPVTQTRRTFTESYNVRGQKTGTSRQRTTLRAVRETVDVDQVCRHCGATRSVRETRER